MADSYPILPEKNWKDLRTQFRKTMPSSVTPSYLQSLLNLSSEKSARNLMSPLKRFGIIDDLNKPTDRALSWRDDTSYADVCQQIAIETYPAELREIYPAPSQNKEGVINWFMRTTGSGRSSAQLVSSTYTYLMEPSLLTPEESAKPKGNSGKATTTKMRAKKNELSPKLAKTETVAATEETPLDHPVKAPHKAPTVYIDLQIHISPEADATQIDAIFASMAKHLYR
ncbi:MAG TPA: DUF5343 domain-containing protein [Selenomonadales bacterium]|nr:DUF5343 domain-containing protein [Selenomonadales bacterium]